MSKGKWKRQQTQTKDGTGQHGNDCEVMVVKIVRGMVWSMQQIG
jgi:hypothetical protein